MHSYGKIAVATAFVLVIGSLVAWAEATPIRQQTFGAGTLGSAVARECAPDRVGDFKTEATLSRAISCRDLAAQESMALSTQRLVWLSWAQIFVGLGGTVAVVWTVIISLGSMKVTQRALEHQQVATRMELRPNFIPLPIAAKDDGKGRYRISVLFKNTGASTAKRVRQHIIWKVVPLSREKSSLDASQLRLQSLAFDKSKDGTAGMHFTTSVGNTLLLKAGTHSLQVAYISIYDDDLGGRYCVTYGREAWGPDLAAGRSLREFAFTDPELKGREP
jgi:hypothetical protein